MAISRIKLNQMMSLALKYDRKYNTKKELYKHVSTELDISFHQALYNLEKYFYKDKYKKIKIPKIPNHNINIITNKNYEIIHIHEKRYKSVYEGKCIYQDGKIYIFKTKKGFNICFNRGEILTGDVKIKEI